MLSSGIPFILAATTSGGPLKLTLRPRSASCSPSVKVIISGLVRPACAISSGDRLRITSSFARASYISYVACKYPVRSPPTARPTPNAPIPRAAAPIPIGPQPPNAPGKRRPDNLSLGPAGNLGIGDISCGGAAGCGAGAGSGVVIPGKIGGTSVAQ